MRKGERNGRQCDESPSEEKSKAKKSKRIIIRGKGLSLPKRFAPKGEEERRERERRGRKGEPGETKHEKKEYMSSYMASMEIVAQYGVTVDGIEVRHSDSIASLKGLTEVLNQVRTEHVGVVLAQSDVKLSDMSLQFMSDCLEEQSVSGVIADYIEET